MTAFVLLINLLAFSSLALAMERHHQDILRKRPSQSRRRLLRIIGWSGLVLSYPLTIAAWGAAVGSVVWFGLLSLPAAIVVLVISRLSGKAAQRGG